MKNKNKLTWINIQKKLKGLSDRDLIALIKEVYGLNKELKDFLHAKFYNDKNVIDSYKEKIEKYLTPHPTRWDPPKIAKTKKVIQDYKKATNDNKGILELTVYYYERLTKYRFLYGPDIYVDEPAHVCFISLINNLKDQEDYIITKYLPQILSLRKKWEYAENAEEVIIRVAPSITSFIPKKGSVALKIY